MTAIDKPVREGSLVKRAAILAAARDLFLRDGFERTSMDAVAAQAKVSKRTVYDYYGDKRRLLQGVVEDAAESLVRSLRKALAEHLSDDPPIGTAQELESALTAFAIDLGENVIASADYATVFTLMGEQRVQLPELESPLLLSAMLEDPIGERLAHFHERGLLNAPDSRLAADQLNALTTLLVNNSQPDPINLDLKSVRRTMTEGVRTFMRAYAAQRRM
ncbi:TetR/AcrR family transcriptional regulator [Microbispora bryophytorum]|uniref:TetR/AcrR family transcriptional regulator n=1 Tax=Microbispora bryophytorum TaxID=1460882 RepID=UPI003718D02D